MGDPAGETSRQQSADGARSGDRRDGKGADNPQRQGPQDRGRGNRGVASNTIAFQGEAGANSDMACRSAFPYMTTLPCPTFETAMAAVQAGKAELAMIPVENSIAGRVADLHSLLPHTRLKIVAEHFQRVEHCLVALPGATLKSIKTVKSHVQALSQCRNFLKKHRFSPLVHGDTAGRRARSPRMATPASAPSLPRWRPGSMT